MDASDSKIKFPYLPEGRKILYVSISSEFMQRAKEIARLSNEQQQPTGAVVVSGGRVLSEASNKNPLTTKMLINLHKKYCIRHMFHIPSGEKYWLCPGCAGKESHAESRACKQILNQKKTGPRDLYLWGHWWCCDTCWKNMIKAGIDNIYLLDESFELFNAKSPTNILGKQFPRV